MVSYELIPKIGIGPIRFGMTHREVYAAMGTTPSRILPRGKAVGEEDVSSFHFNGCFKVGYSTETFIVNFIGVFSDNGVDVVYKGIDLFNQWCYLMVEYGKIAKFSNNKPIWRL